MFPVQYLFRLVTIITISSYFLWNHYHNYDVDSGKTSSGILYVVTAWTILQPQQHRYYHRFPQQQRTFLRRLVQLRNSNNRNNNGPTENNKNDNDDDEEEECMGGNNDDSEECEIDWSKMPNFDTVDFDIVRTQLEQQLYRSNSNMMPSSSSLLPSTDNVKEEELLDLNALDDVTFTDATPTPSASSSSSTMQKDFTRLEMIWAQQNANSDECNVYEPITCGGQICSTCSGAGTTSCRFCRGTKFLYLPITHDNMITDNTDDAGDDDFTITQKSHSSSMNSKNSAYISCSICQTSGTEICRTCQGSGWIANWTQMGVRVGK